MNKAEAQVQEESAEIETTQDPKVEKKIMPILQGRFKFAEHERNIWVVQPTAGTVLEDLLNEKYWTHVGIQLGIGDRIEVEPEDSSWWAELKVRAAGRMFAQVVVHQHYIYDVPADHSDRSTANYEVKFIPAHKWRVMRDGEVLQHGFESKKLAEDWARDHAKRVAPVVTI